MSKALAKLLDKSEAEVAALINKLEDLNGYPSEDVRLMAEMLGRSRVKLGQLGLDPDDTTAEELYEALRGRYESDSAQIDKALGVTDRTSLDERQAKVLQLIKHCGPLPEVWALKNSSVRKILQSLPPKKTMKLLNCRSVESFIKKIDCIEVWLAAPYVESASWQRNFSKQVAKLDSANFEIRAAKAVILPSIRWQAMKGSRSPVASSSVIGAVAIWPAKLPDDTPALTLSLYLLEGLHNLTGQDISVSLYRLHPALSWWADTAQLISSQNDQPVSFNIWDTATSHLRDYDFARRSSRYVCKSLLRNLLARYERQPEQLSQLLDIGSPNDKNWQVPAANQLVREYVTVE